MVKETVTPGADAATGGRDCPHTKGRKAKECMACELEQGERIAARLAEVMREEGVTEPAEQFGILLGLGASGFARGGTDRDVVLDAVGTAFDKATGGPSSG